MLKYLVFAVTVVYALLPILAAGAQLRTAAKKDTSVLMILGGVLLLLSVGLELPALWDGWLIAALGGVCVCVAAFLNGRRSGSFHLQHHVIRLALTLLLVIGFYML